VCSAILVGVAMSVANCTSAGADAVALDALVRSAAQMLERGAAPSRQDLMKVIPSGGTWTWDGDWATWRRSGCTVILRGDRSVSDTSLSCTWASQQGAIGGARRWLQIVGSKLPERLDLAQEGKGVYQQLQVNRGFWVEVAAGRGYAAGWQGQISLNTMAHGYSY
jgi:hypothetical protein